MRAKADGSTLMYTRSLLREKPVTLSQALKIVRPLKHLKYIPTTSWAGGDWVWTQRSENQIQWSLTNEAANYLRRIGEKCGQDSATYQIALFAMFIALNSDVIHREYTMVTHTEAWAREVEFICRFGSREASKLSSLGLTLNLEKHKTLEDCRGCGSFSIVDYAPQLLLVAVLTSLLIVLLGKRVKKRDAEK